MVSGLVENNKVLCGPVVMGLVENKKVVWQAWCRPIR